MSASDQGNRNKAHRRGKSIHLDGPESARHSTETNRRFKLSELPIDAAAQIRGDIDRLRQEGRIYSYRRSTDVERRALRIDHLVGMTSVGFTQDQAAYTQYQMIRGSRIVAIVEIDEVDSTSDSCKIGP